MVNQTANCTKNNPSLPFYRLLSVNNISNDAVADEEKGLVYEIQVENKLVNLAQGMTVSVEIKTGKIRLIEYYLSPLLQYRQESARER